MTTMLSVGEANVMIGGEKNHIMSLTLMTSMYKQVKGGLYIY